MNRSACISIYAALLFVAMSLSLSAQWRSLPIRSKEEFDAGMPGGEGEQYPQGFARCLYHPEYIYAAQDVGGCWRSSDGGASWRKTLDKGLYLQFGQSIEVDPANPLLVMMVVDKTWMWRGKVADFQGIYRSEDGGESWEQVFNTTTKNVRRIRHLMTYSLPTMANDSASPTRWYAVFDDNGLYRSDNSGKKDSWVLAAQFNGTPVEVVAHPLSTDTVYIASYNGLFRSTNGGADLSPWKFAGKKVTSVMLSPKIPNQMYVAVSGEGLYYSANAGNTFTRIPINVSSADQSTKLSHAVINQGFPEQIYAIGGNDVRSTWVTGDAGNTWKALPLAVTFPGLDRETGWRRWIDGDFSYVCPNSKDKAQAVATARSTFFQITDTIGTLHLFESAAGYTGNASSWWAKCMAFHPTDPNIFALFCFDVGPRVTTTGGNWFHTRDPKITTWKYTNKIIEWTGSYSGSYQPLAGSKVVVASIGLYNEKSQLMRSTNLGITWDNVVTVVNGDTQTNLQGYEYVGFDSQAPNIVYAGNRISTDAGLTFRPISFPAESVVNGELPNVYGMSKDFAGNTYVFALDANRQKIYRSDDHGVTWFLFASLGDVGASARYTNSQPTFTPHPNNPNIIFTLDKQADLLKAVYNSVTKAVTYTSLNVFNSLPSWMPAGISTFNQIKYIVVDPVNPKVIYVTTIVAGIPSVYRSLDGGTSWQSISDDFPHMPGTTVLNPHTRELFRGSMNGTSIYPAAPADHNPPAPPTSKAGPDQSVVEDTFITLDGTGSTDPQGDPLVYSWTAPAGITLSSAMSPKPTFIAPEVKADTNYTFTLTVNNGTTSSAADQVIITVRNVNKLPVADAGEDQSVTEGTLVTLDGTGSSDGDDDQLTYSWTAPDGIVLSSSSDVNPTFTAPDVSANTTYAFSLTVNDGTTGSVADRINVTVKPVVNAEEGKMKIYPNPTHGQVKVVFDRLYTDGAYLTVSDMSGRTMLKKYILSEEETVDLTGMPAGIYLINTSVKGLKGQKIVLN